MSLTVRRMAAADVAAVRRVAEQTWSATYAGIIPEAVQAEFLRRAYSKAALQRRMQEDVFLVALWDGALIGFADFRRLGPGLAELAAIYVLPTAQGQGVGGELLATGLRALPDVETVRLDVERENRPGQRFYAARGFTAVEEYVERFSGHDLHLVRMIWQRSWVGRVPDHGAPVQRTHNSGAG